MLLNYCVSNYCSFSEMAEFDMIAPSGKVKKRFPDNFVELNNGCQVLKTAVIVGENAGGKSNFINSLKFFQSLFKNNNPVKAVNAFINTNIPEKERVTAPQTFSIEIAASNKLIYEYSLTIDMKHIVRETLSYKVSEKKKATLLLGVEWDEMLSQYNVEVVGVSSEIKTAMKKSLGTMGLFVTKLALLGSEHALAFVDWINESLFPISVMDERNYNALSDGSDIRILKDDRFLEIFRMVDYSICDIAVDRERPYAKTMIIRKRADGEKIGRELQLDSTGVREFFSWAVQIFRVVYENKIVFADEMDRVLNPVLSDRVIAFLNGKEHYGQFVFSTHNVLHLDLKTYMKEQIYFITKGREELNSELYSLSDFPEVRYETSKIYEFYMKGILGGTAFE